MAFRAQTTVREPFLPRDESERWPNTPAPEITTSIKIMLFLCHVYSANGTQDIFLHTIFLNTLLLSYFLHLIIKLKF